MDICDFIKLCVNCFWILFVTITAQVTTEQEFAGEVLEDYCSWETFRASCSDDEVIVVTRAYYGRMSHGRCIPPEFGYVGCYSSVLHLAHTHCSGRRHCNITVPDRMFDSTQPCRHDLKLYLLIQYKCLKALQPSGSGECRNPEQGQESQAGVLASSVTSSTGCGSVDSPWVLRVGLGQRINITLMDFTQDISHNGSDSSSASRTLHRGGHTTCRVYGVIKDLVSMMSFTVCGGVNSKQLERGHFGYLSDSHSVEVRLPSIKADRMAGKFLLRYEAVGCPDVTSPHQVSWSRTGPNGTLGCADGRTWLVICEGRRWVGIESANCSQQDPLGQALVAFSFPLSHFGATLLVLIIATVVGICIFFFGVCFIRRKRERLTLQRRSVDANKVHSIYGQPDEMNYPSGKWSNHPGHVMYPSAAVQGLYPSATPRGVYSGHGPARAELYESDDNEYAYVDDLQLPSNNAHGYTSAKAPVNSNNSYGLLSPQHQHGSGGFCGHLTGNDYSLTSEESRLVAMPPGQQQQQHQQPSYFTLKHDSRCNSLPHDLDSTI